MRLESRSLGADLARLPIPSRFWGLGVLVAKISAEAQRRFLGWGSRRSSHSDGKFSEASRATEPTDTHHPSPHRATNKQILFLSPSHMASWLHGFIEWPTFPNH